MFVYTIQPVVNPLSNRLSNGFDNRLYRVYKHSTGCQRFDKKAVLCIQLVVKPVVQPSLTTGWTNSGCSFNTVVKLVVKPGCTTGLTTMFNEQSVCSTRLSNRLSNLFDNRLYRVYKHSVGCQTGLTTGWTFVYTIQPVVKPVVQPGWQPVVSCKWGFSFKRDPASLNDIYVLLFWIPPTVK